MLFLEKNIKHIRIQKGLTQEQFDDNLKVSRSRISSYEENRATPPLNFIIALSNYANISIDVLLKKNLDNLEL